MRIYWFPFAVERLENIFEYTSNEDIDSAHKLIIRIFNNVVSKLSERGRKVQEATEMKSEKSLKADIE